MVRKTTIALIVLGFVVACKPKYEAPDFSAGDIDPTRFVMIGGSQTAGYMDDALTAYGQENSLANLIAGQLAEVGGGAFNQPLVSESSVGVSLSGLSVLQLGYKTDCEGVTSLSPVRKSTSGDLTIWSEQIYSSNSHFGNFGIPGIKLSDYQSAGYATTNAFYGRMASGASASVVSDAIAENPTFFALYAGLDEVIAYAKSGATGTPLMSAQEFSQSYGSIIQSLTANGAKGVISTLPEVTEMPYFTTIPYDGLALTSADQSNLDLLNNIYNPLGYFFHIGNNPFMIVDSTANDFFVRQTLPGERLLLSIPLDSVKCYQMGVLYPFRDEFVLDQLELNVLRAQIDAYNQEIISLADQYGLALVRADQFYAKLTDGFAYNGINMSAKFVSGGAYSLDGLQLNPKGNALLANEYIKAINTTYHARIPQLNAVELNGAIFP
jgi:hypothetical protein